MPNKKKPKINMTDPESLKNAGNQEFQKGNYAQAIDFYSQAIELDGSNAIYYSNRANVYIEQEEYEKAVSDCSKAIEIDPGFVKAYYRKGLAHFEMVQEEGSAQKAIEHFKKAVELDPQSEEFKEILDFAVQEAKEDNYCPEPAEKERFQAMFDWMLEKGANFDKLKMRYYAPDYRGVHASRDIKKGETILYVPKNELITLEMAIESPIGAKMFAQDLRNRLISPKHSFLATYVMQERRKEVSFFDTYIDILPKAFDNFPIFYTQEERSWLEGSPFQDQISDKIKDIGVDYNMICNCVPEYRQFSLKEYSQIRMMVSSRIFGIQIDGVKTDAFVPYADMLNHKRPRQTVWTYTDDRAGFIIEACEDIKRGEQVFDSYGQKCNTRFLLNYGFINLDNDANEYPYTVRLQEDDQYLQQKMDMMAQPQLSKSFRIQVNFEVNVVSKFISFLRFSEFDGNLTLLYQIKFSYESKRRPRHEDSDDEPSSSFNADDIPIISRRNERRVWQRVRQLSLEALERYPQTLEEDMEILKRDDLTFNQRNCCLFRSGEKEILHFYIEFSEYCCKLLDMKFADAKKFTKNLPAQYESCRDYLQNCLIKQLQNEPNEQ